MKKKLVKFLSIGLSALMFMLSYSPAAYAKSESEVTPGEYVLLTAFSACGIYTGNAGGQWISAYKGYLESIGDTAMLNQVNGYDNLSWGGTATNIDKLYSSIKGWLSKSDAYGTDARFYTLPSKASPIPSKITDSVGISPTSFSDVNPVTDSNYQYLFSDTMNGTASSGRAYQTKRNFYGPAGKDIFAIGSSFVGYADKVSITFYYVDKTSSTGYTKFDVQRICTSFYIDTGAAMGKDVTFSGTNAVLGYDIKSLMNMPIKVFSNADDAKTYAQTGVANNLFGKNSCSLWYYTNYGVNTSLQNTTNFNIGETMKLPTSNSAAVSAYNATRGNMDLGNVSDKLSACGMEISFPEDYTVEHYQQTIDGNSWTKSDTEQLSGVAGSTATYTVKFYPGFTHDESLTVPDNLRLSGDGSLVIKLYYNRNIIDYTINHYQQDLDGKSWTKVDIDARSGLYGSDAEYTINSYPGFTYDESLTTGDETLTKPMTIDLYYSRNTIDYVVNHHQQNIDGKGWVKVDTENLSGLYGSDVSYTAKSYQGFTCDESLTTGIETLIKPITIDLYYSRNPISYTVEHYQGLVSLGSAIEWTLIDTENLSGLYGATALYVPKKYKGYTYNSSLTSANDLTLSGNGSLTIKLYYTKPQEVDSLESSVANIGDIVSPAAIVGIVFVCLSFLCLFLVKLFRRTMRQASGMGK